MSTVECGLSEPEQATSEELSGFGAYGFRLQLRSDIICNAISVLEMVVDVVMCNCYGP
jgi:hypothetical protein